MFESHWSTPVTVLFMKTFDNLDQRLFIDWYGREIIADEKCYQANFETIESYFRTEIARNRYLYFIKSE